MKKTSNIYNRTARFKRRSRPGFIRPSIAEIFMSDKKHEPIYDVSISRSDSFEEVELTFVINTCNIADGTTVVGVISGCEGSAFTDNSLHGICTINNNTGVFTKTFISALTIDAINLFNLEIELHQDTEFGMIIEVITDIGVLDLPINPVIGRPTVTVTPDVNGIPKIIHSGSLVLPENFIENHLHSNWRVLDESGVVWEVSGDAINKTSITIPDGVLQAAVDYLLEVTYVDANYGASEPGYGSITGNTFDVSSRTIMTTVERHISLTSMVKLSDTKLVLSYDSSSTDTIETVILTVTESGIEVGTPLIILASVVSNVCMLSENRVLICVSTDVDCTVHLLDVSGSIPVSIASENIDNAVYGSYRIEAITSTKALMVYHYMIDIVGEYSYNVASYWGNVLNVSGDIISVGPAYSFGNDVGAVHICSMSSTQVLCCVYGSRGTIPPLYTPSPNYICLLNVSDTSFTAGPHQPVRELGALDRVSMTKLSNNKAVLCYGFEDGDQDKSMSVVIALTGDVISLGVHSMFLHSYTGVLCADTLSTDKIVVSCLNGLHNECSMFVVLKVLGDRVYFEYSRDLVSSEEEVGFQSLVVISPTKIVVCSPSNGWANKYHLLLIGE